MSLAEFEFRVSGIPCIVSVEEYSYTPPYRGSVYSCDSDIDWYGDEEIYYSILDRKGYAAPWLEKKITDSEDENIREAIRNHFSD